MKAAKEAAAKVNAMLVASGQLKLSDIEKAKCNKPGNLFVEEVVINDATISARNFLTMCSTQEKISKMSGASVSTKGRYMNDEELKTNTTERPLHLQIQGINEQDVKVAVGRIMHIIMKHSHRPQQPKYKGNKNFGGNQGEKHKSRFANIEESTFPVLQNMIFREKVFMPPTAGLNPIDIRNQLIGENGTNFMYIIDDTGASVTLRGVGSGFLEVESGQEAPEALHFYLEHSNQEQFNHAKELVVNLAQTVLAEMQEGLQSLTQPHLNPIQQPLGTPVNPLSMAAPFEPQQLYGAPSQVIVPAVPQVITRLAPPMVAHSVAPINSYQPQQTSSPYVIASQPVMSQVVSHNHDIAATSSNNIVAPVIPISVQTQDASQMIPQLVQVTHGTQIIGTPDGPRLITVVCTANGATIMSEPAPVTTLATLQAPIVPHQHPHPSAHVLQPTCLEAATQQEHFDNRGEPLYPHVTIPIVTAQPTPEAFNLPPANVNYHPGPLTTAPVECPDGSLVQSADVHVVSPVNEMNPPQFALEVSDGQNWNVEPQMNTHANGSAVRPDYDSQLFLQPQPGQLPWSRYPNLPQSSVKPGPEMVKGFMSDEGPSLEAANLNRLQDGGVAPLDDTNRRPFGFDASFAPNFYQHTGVRPYSVDIDPSLQPSGFNVTRGGMMEDTDDQAMGPSTSSAHLPGGYPNQIENPLAMDPISGIGLKQSINSIYSRRSENLDVTPSTYKGPIEYNHSMRPKFVSSPVGRDNNGPSAFPYSSRRPFSHQRNY